MTFDLIQPEGILLFGRPLTLAPPIPNPAFPRFPLQSNTPKCRDSEPSGLGVLRNEGPTAPPPKPRRQSPFQSHSLHSILFPSHRARHPGGLCQTLGTSFPLVPAGPQFHGKRGRQEGTDRWTWTGCGKASPTGRRREAGAPLEAGGSGPLGAGSGSLQSCPISSGAGVAA